MRTETLFKAVPLYGQNFQRHTDSQTGQTELPSKLYRDVQYCFGAGVHGGDGGRGLQVPLLQVHGDPPRGVLRACRGLL